MGRPRRLAEPLIEPAPQQAADVSSTTSIPNWPMIAIDGGRLMTGRIGDETKFDTAIHASLALMSACASQGSPFA